MMSVEFRSVDLFSLHNFSNYLSVNETIFLKLVQLDLNKEKEEGEEVCVYLSHSPQFALASGVMSCLTAQSDRVTE